MRFLVDECTGPKVAVWLRDQGHEIFSVFDEARGNTRSKRPRRATPQHSAKHVSLRLPFVCTSRRHGPTTLHPLLPLAARDIERFKLFTRISQRFATRLARL